MDKEKKKLLRRNIGWFFLRFFVLINGKLPLGWSYFLGKTFGSLAYAIVVRHRKIAIDSLSVAFPKKTLKEKKRIARDFFVFMAQSSLELLYFLRNPQDLKNIRIEGLENLKKAQAKGKGVLLLTAHLGNFPLLSLRLAEEGYPVYFVTRPMRDERAGNYIHDLRTKAGVRTIFSYPRRECVNGIIDALRSNGLVIMQMDQNFGTGGVWVKFFGKLAATPVGPIVFALRTQSAVVPTYIFREAKGKHCIRILPQEELITKEDKDETVLLNAIKLTRLIEPWIREFASQWGWIHRRWKSRPSPKVKVLKFRIEPD